MALGDFEGFGSAFEDQAGSSVAIVDSGSHGECGGGVLPLIEIDGTLEHHFELVRGLIHGRCDRYRAAVEGHLERRWIGNVRRSAEGEFEKGTHAIVVGIGRVVAGENR